MKKILKILLTISFIIVSIAVIYKLIKDYSFDGLGIFIIAFTFFCMHLFAWIAPKTFFNLCWKTTKIMPDDVNFDYEAGYRKLESSGLGILIVANVLLIIGLLVI